MRLKTLQNKSVLDILKQGKIYYADYGKIRYKDYIPQWKRLSEYCGFSHCPIFCVPIDNDEAIEASQLKQNNNDIIIELNVPNNECVLMDYYDFSSYLYYSSGQEYDDYFGWGKKKALENIDKYIKLGEHNGTPQICIEKIDPKWVLNLNESLLLEKSRAELISKSKNAVPTKSYGTTRYERKDVQHIYNPKKSLNNLDMNALFRASLLSLKIPVQGETNNYNVEILFDGILDAINRELKSNGHLEYKVIYRAIIDAINKQNIYVACDCPDHKYRFAYWGSKERYNAGTPQTIPTRFTNPKNNQGADCKHVLKVLADLDWALDLATCINNYIIYMEEHYPDKYKEVIVPAIYNMSYIKALDQGLIEPPETELDDEIPDDELDIEDEEEVIEEPEDEVEVEETSDEEEEEEE